MHKVKAKKEVKYNIRVTRDGSLIGISDFAIPSTVIQKKQDTFSKLCSVIMIDSTKRMLFGNISGNNTIKMEVLANISYFDKTPALKQSHSLPKSDMKKMALSPKVQALKSSKMNELMKQSSNVQRETKTPPMHNIAKPPTTKKKAQSKSVQSTSNKATSNKLKSPKPDSNNVNGNSRINNPDLIYSSETRDQLDPNVDKNDVSVIDELALFEIGEIQPSFQEIAEKFVESNPIEKLNEGTGEEVYAKTEDLGTKIFDYQKEYFEAMKKAIDTHTNLKDLLYKYNEKYRYIIKKKNRLEELKNHNSIKNQIVVNLNRDEASNIKTNFIPFKQSEFELYKLIFGLSYDKPEIKEFNEKCIEENLEKDENGKLLLKTALNVINKYGPLTKINITLSEEEREKLKKIIAKYKLPSEEINNIKEESEEEIDEKENPPTQYEQNVIAASLDASDVKLNNYLNSYYSKHKVPKVPFKKTSKNNYEYGNQKIMVKIEGETIRVRYIGGYVLLDKFIEMNAKIEEMHLNKSSGQSTKGKKSKK